MVPDVVGEWFPTSNSVQIVASSFKKKRVAKFRIRKALITVMPRDLQATCILPTNDDEVGMCCTT